MPADHLLGRQLPLFCRSAVAAQLPVSLTPAYPRPSGPHLFLLFAATVLTTSICGGISKDVKDAALISGCGIRRSLWRRTVIRLAAGGWSGRWNCRSRLRGIRLAWRHEGSRTPLPEPLRFTFDQIGISLLNPSLVTSLLLNQGAAAVLLQRQPRSPLDAFQRATDHNTARPARFEKGSLLHIRNSLVFPALLEERQGTEVVRTGILRSRVDGRSQVIDAPLILAGVVGMHACPRKLSGERRVSECWRHRQE